MSKKVVKKSKDYSANPETNLNNRQVNLSHDFAVDNLLGQLAEPEEKPAETPEDTAGVPMNFVIRCRICRWAKATSGTADDLAELKEMKNNCSRCGKWRRFRCPKCGGESLMKRVRGNT